MDESNFAVEIEKYIVDKTIYTSVLTKRSATSTVTSIGTCVVIHLPAQGVCRDKQQLLRNEVQQKTQYCELFFVLAEVVRWLICALRQDLMAVLAVSSSLGLLNGCAKNNSYRFD